MPHGAVVAWRRAPALEPRSGWRVTFLVADLGLWEILGQNGEIQEKIHELTLFYYIMHDEPSRALSSEIFLYFALSTSCICLYFRGAMYKIQTSISHNPILEAPSIR